MHMLGVGMLLVDHSVLLEIIEELFRKEITSAEQLSGNPKEAAEVENDAAGVRNIKREKGDLR